MEFAIILKKLKNQLSAEEKLEFDKWYKASKDHRIFFQKVKSDFKSESTPIDQERAWIGVKSKLNKKNNSSSKWKYALAAILIVTLGSTIFFKLINNPTLPPSASPIENKIVLTTEDGTEIDLAPGKLYKTKYVIGSEKQLNYTADSKSPSKISYNFLTIPRGKQFTIQLSDNTRIWLNSDTKIKYPVRFKNDEPRLVEVIYGEAYFDVSPRAENNGMNFLVKTKTQLIEVLGTEFNIKAYKEDKLIATTLAEGKIVLSNQDNSLKNELEPGFQSIFNPENANWIFTEVDVENEISWKNGIFTFKNKELIDIMANVSRWYDVEIEFTNKSLEDVKFNGVIRRSQSLENILTILRETGKIEYETVNQKIIIKEKSEMKNKP